MPRLDGTLMNGKAFTRGSAMSVLNPALGGQMGYSPDLREWVNNAAYVQRNLIAYLIEAPAFFDYMPDPQRWYESLRALIEVCPRSIDGFNHEIRVDTDSTPVGGAGEIQQEYTNVTRERSSPTFVWNDKYGRPIQRMLEQWITYGLMDPSTKFANIGTLDNYPTDMLPDRYSMTCLFVEPDPTHRAVMRSFLCTNMFPTSTGTSTARRDITAAATIPELSIEFTAITQVGAGVDAFAQKVLDMNSITGANPFMRSAFVQEIARSVEAANVGYAARIADIAEDASAFEAGNM